MVPLLGKAHKAESPGSLIRNTREAIEVAWRHLVAVSAHNSHHERAGSGPTTDRAESDGGST